VVGCDRIGVFSPGPGLRGRPRRGGARGGSERRVCAAHKQAGDGLVRGFGQPCRTAGCLKQASFGAEGGPPLSCRAHSEPGDVDTRTAKCRRAGCDKQAFCGSPADRVPSFCGNHRREGDVNLRNRVPPPPSRTNRTRRVPHPVLIAHAASLSQVCQHPEGCTKVPNFGPAGGAPRRCRLHMTRSDVSLRRRACMFVNPRGERSCSRCASFGDPADGRPRFCLAHCDRLAHVNLVARRCQSAPRPAPTRPAPPRPAAPRHAPRARRARADGGARRARRYPGCEVQATFGKGDGVHVKGLKWLACKFHRSMQALLNPTPPPPPHTANVARA
jgi:hypothetical protein